MGESILLLEDEKNLGSTLRECLKEEGFEPLWVETIAAGTRAIQQHAYALALLDIGLPDGSGFDFAVTLREKSPSTAIIFLTAHGSPEDRIKGLELGAEDYVVKPFHLHELILRIRNGLKRAHALQANSASESGVQIGEAKIYFSRFEAERSGRRTPLTHKECQVLKLLFDRNGQVVSRDEILNEVWSENEFPTTRTVDNFILRLRKLIEKDSENPKHLRSVRGVGYQLL